MQIFRFLFSFALLPLFLPPDRTRTRTQTHTHAYGRRMQLCIILCRVQLQAAHCIFTLAFILGNIQLTCDVRKRIEFA